MRFAIDSLIITKKDSRPRETHRGEIKKNGDAVRFPDAVGSPLLGLVIVHRTGFPWCEGVKKARKRLQSATQGRPTSGLLDISATTLHAPMPSSSRHRSQRHSGSGSAQCQVLAVAAWCALEERKRGGGDINSVLTGGTGQLSLVIGAANEPSSAPVGWALRLGKLLLAHLVFSGMQLVEQKGLVKLTRVVDLHLKIYARTELGSPST